MLVRVTRSPSAVDSLKNPPCLGTAFSQVAKNSKKHLMLDTSLLSGLKPRFEYLDVMASMRSLIIATNAEVALVQPVP